MLAMRWHLDCKRSRYFNRTVKHFIKAVNKYNAKQKQPMAVKKGAAKQSRINDITEYGW